MEHGAQIIHGTRATFRLVRTARLHFFNPLEGDSYPTIAPGTTAYSPDSPDSLLAFAVLRDGAKCTFDSTACCCGTLH